MTKYCNERSNLYPPHSQDGIFGVGFAIILYILFPVICIFSSWATCHASASGHKIHLKGKRYMTDHITSQSNYNNYISVMLRQF